MMTRAELIESLQPSRDELREIALRETDPERQAEFAPITRGPVFAVLAVIAIIAVSLPSCAFRLCRGLLRAAGSNHRQ